METKDPFVTNSMFNLISRPSQTCLIDRGDLLTRLNIMRETLTESSENRFYSSQKYGVFHQPMIWRTAQDDVYKNMIIISTDSELELLAKLEEVQSRKK